MFQKLHSDSLYPVHPLISAKEKTVALSVHYLPYCTPFPRLNQSLQGDWFLSWFVSELHVEEVEACRVQVEAVLLGLRKKDMPLVVDFFCGSSDCCWDLSCWLMMIWMSSWGKVGRKRKWAWSLRSWNSIWCLMFGEKGMSALQLWYYLYIVIWQQKCVFIVVVTLSVWAHWCWMNLAVLTMWQYPK